MSTTKRENLDRIILSAKPKLIISENVQQQIDYLHDKYDVEWSGELITREEGSISNPSEWKIIAEDIYLADIGTSAYTKYDVGDDSWKEDDILEMYEQFPGLMDGTHKNQHIHSHHSMGAFFSSTDEEQLEDRAETSNYLVMLIVNFKKQYVAKVAFKGRKKSRGEVCIEMCNNTDNYGGITITGDVGKDILVVMDCEIEYPTVVNEPSNFLKRCNKVKSDKTTSYTTYKKEETKSKSYYQGELYNADGTSWKPKAIENNLKNKSVMEMTDDEWEQFNVDSYNNTEVKTYDNRDCKIFLNAVLDKMITVNTKFPLNRIGILPENGKTSFLDRVQNESFEYFTDLFKSNDFGDYLSFLNTLKEFVVSYKFVDEVFLELTELIEEEIVDISQSLLAQ